MKKVCYAFILGLLSVTFVSAQEAAVPIIKPEVQESQVMFKKTIWRRMDLREKQNLPFFSKNSEISKFLLQAVEDGLLKPYVTDSCLNLMTDAEFQSKVTVESQGGGGGFGGGFGGFGDESSSQNAGPSTNSIPKDLFDVLYIKEDLIFDRNRSRMYWYIRSISLALPARAGSTWNPAGFENIVCHFKYEDVVALFRGPYAEKAIWYNSQNQAQHRNYGDALELRLFSAPIIKVSNPNNLDIRQIIGDQGGTAFDAVMLQQKMEYDLMEYESELWEN